MRCEICGSQIRGKPRKAVIEGATLIVCEDCARHSSQVTPLTMGRTKPLVSLPLPRERKPQPRFKPVREAVENYTIVEGFGGLIKRAREERGWTQEELASKVGEKASLIGKLETEKVYPSFEIARKIEHALGVKLITRIPEAKPEAYLKVKPEMETPTLGDVAVFRDKRVKAG